MRTWKNYLCMLAALVVTLGFTAQFENLGELVKMAIFDA